MSECKCENECLSQKVVVGFGEVMLRLCPDQKLRLAQTLPGTLNATFGGGEANVCASLSMLGESARYVTALPDNAVAGALQAQLRGLGVDVSRILAKPSGRMGIYFVETGSNHRPSKVIYDREHSVISETSPEEYDYAAILKDAKWLHISGITPALSEKAYLSTLAIAERAVSENITVSCDLNFRKKLWKWNPEYTQPELARRCMEKIVPLVDVIIGNEADAADVFGICAEQSDIEAGEIALESYHDVAVKLSAKFPKATRIAITLRESVSADCNRWGAMLYDTQKSAPFYGPVDADGSYQPYYISDIVDRVGGGDSFAAGLIYALNSDKYSSPQQAVNFAVAASCLKHSVKGDFNYVTLEEVLALAGGNISGRIQR